MALAIAAPLLLLNTLSFRELVDAQSGYYFGFLPRWTIFQGPFPQIVSFLLFMVAAFCGNQPHPVRSAGSRERAGGRLPYRIQQHEVRGVLHGRIRQHGHGFVRRGAVVPRRMAPALPRRIRLEVPSDSDLRHRWSGVLLPRPESGASLRSDHTSDRGRRISRSRSRISGAAARADPGPAVLVCCKGGRHSVPVHLGARHAAAFSL